MSWKRDPQQVVSILANVSFSPPEGHCPRSIAWPPLQLTSCLMYQLHQDMPAARDAHHLLAAKELSLTHWMSGLLLSYPLVLLKNNFQIKYVKC